MSRIAHLQRRGFTLIELLVAMVIFSFMIVLALPNYTEFVRNSEIRTAAESIESALQLARAEAVRRNLNVQVQLLNTLNGATVSGGTDWTVLAATVAAPTTYDQAVQSRNDGRRTSNARAGVATAVSSTVAAAGANMPATITFTGLGRLTAGTTVRQIDITGATGARNLSIQLTPGGGIRLCNPGLALSSNPQGCS